MIAISATSTKINSHAHPTGSAVALKSNSHATGVRISIARRCGIPSFLANDAISQDAIIANANKGKPGLHAKGVCR